MVSSVAFKNFLILLVKRNIQVNQVYTHIYETDTKFSLNKYIYIYFFARLRISTDF